VKKSAAAYQGFQGYGPPNYAPYGQPQAPAVTWRAKAGYVGTGIVIGLVIYPFVRKSAAMLQPGLDKLFDSLTGKAEGVAEMAADLIAKAKQNVQDVIAAEEGKGVAKKKTRAKPHVHKHRQEEEHDHAHQEGEDDDH